MCVLQILEPCSVVVVGGYFRKGTSSIMLKYYLI